MFSLVLSKLKCYGIWSKRQTKEVFLLTRTRRNGQAKMFRLSLNDFVIFFALLLFCAVKTKEEHHLSAPFSCLNSNVFTMCLLIFVQSEDRFVRVDPVEQFSYFYLHNETKPWLWRNWFRWFKQFLPVVECPKICKPFARFRNTACVVFLVNLQIATTAE